MQVFENFWFKRSLSLPCFSKFLKNRGGGSKYSRNIHHWCVCMQWTGAVSPSSLGEFNNVSPKISSQALKRGQNSSKVIKDLNSLILSWMGFHVVITMAESTECRYKEGQNTQCARVVRSLQFLDRNDRDGEKGKWHLIHLRERIISTRIQSKSPPGGTP